MKLEQYKAAYVPQGVRDVPYRWHKPAEKSGFNIGGLIEGIGNGAASLLGAANDSAQKILKMKEKLQDERDETEAKTISMEMQAEQNTFDVTLDEEKDNERLEQMREKYTQKVYQNKTLSGRAQQAMLEGIDRSFSIQKIRIDGSRMKLIDNQHTVQLKSLMQDAIRNGDLEGARGNYDALATKGVALPAWDIVKSQTVYYNNMAALSEMSSQKLYEENLFATEQLRNGKEIDGMSRSDSLLYAKQTHAVLADRNRNDILLYGDLMRQKKITFAELKDKHGAGELTDSAFETLRRDAANADYKSLVLEADAVLTAAASGEVSEADASSAMVLLRNEIKERNRLGLFDAEEAKKFLNAVDRKDLSLLRQETERIKAVEKSGRESLKWKVYRTEWSSNESERREQRKAIETEILNHPLLSREGKMSLLDIVASRIKDHDNPSSYKHSFVYQNAMARLAGMKGDFTSYAEPARRKLTNLWIAPSASAAEKDVTVGNYEMMKLKLDDFIRNNPDASPEAVNKFIDETKAFINQQAVQDLVAAWLKVEIPNTGFKTGGLPAGTVRDGWKFKGGDPKDRNNWEKAQ